MSLSCGCVSRIPLWLTFGSVRKSKTTSRWSKMEQKKLSNPSFVFKNFLSENLILSLSVFVFCKIPKSLWIDSLSFCSAIAF